MDSSRCRLTGDSEAEVLGRDFQGITHPDDFGTDILNTLAVLDGETHPTRSRSVTSTCGFTTNKDGHSHGLHSSMLAAQGMGGPGCCATSTIKLPADV